MAGVILETLSNKKLIVFSVGLFICQLIFILVGGLVAPAPSNVQNVLATKCLDLKHHINPSEWFWSRGPGHCVAVESFTDPLIVDNAIDANHVVFTFQLPLPRENKKLTMSRWFQSLVSIIKLDIDYHKDASHEVANSKLFLDVRLGYSNENDPNATWIEIARSSEERQLHCELNSAHLHDDQYTEYDGEPMECDMLSFFELGSCDHDYYLVNIRIPIDEDRNINTDIPGKLKDIHLVVISQNGGFTKVWVSIKTVVFPIVAATLAWFWWRIRQLDRPPNLLERTLMALGLALSLLNLPVEWLTLALSMPFMQLYSDIKQGLFYSVLLSFWIIFAGEHMMDSIDRSNLVSYWKHLGAVAFGCMCLFVFEMCERGVQLQNPFYSIWATEGGSRMALAFIVLAGISACCYFLFLCYMIFQVFRNISAKKSALPSMSKARRKFYSGLIFRFKFLMITTLLCVAMTVVFFMVGQVSEGKWKWDYDLQIQYTSSVLTGVYGMWNLYVFSLLILYAPSRKYIQAAITEEDTNEEDENIEFTTLPSEVSALRTFVQKAAND